MLISLFLLSSLSLKSTSFHTNALLTSPKTGLSVGARNTPAAALVKWDIRLSSPPAPPPAPGLATAELWPSTFVNFSSPSINTTSHVGSVRAFFDADLFETPASTIHAINSSSITPICYFSAGTYESWRPDAHLFPKSVLGNPLEDWPGERYLDIRSPVVKTLMKKRIEMAWAKGCKGIDPDNVDGFELDLPQSSQREVAGRNADAGAATGTGFNLTQKDAVAYVRWLCGDANQVSGGKMLCGLKNAPELIPQVLDGAGGVDFAVVEECVRYGSCGNWEMMVERGLPVLGIEYPFEAGGESGEGKEGLVKKWCRFEDGSGNRKGGRIKGMSTVLKRLELDGWGIECPY